MSNAVKIMLMKTAYIMQEAGYTFQIRGEPQMKRGTLCLVSADNLASNAMGGFKEGSTANRGCRHCFATPDQLKSVFDERFLELRTPSDHNSKCDELDDAETQVEHDQLSKNFGINHRSTLDSLDYFSVCSGALVPDVMMYLKVCYCLYTVLL